jgi:hypothetical protein
MSNNELVPIGLEFTSEEWTAVETAATAKGLTVDAFIRAAIRETVGR